MFQLYFTYFIYFKFYSLSCECILISQSESLCFDKCVWFNAFWPLPTPSFSAELWILAGRDTQGTCKITSVPTSNCSWSAVFPKLSVWCLGFFRCFALAELLHEDVGYWWYCDCSEQHHLPLNYILFDRSIVHFISLIHCLVFALDILFSSVHKYMNTEFKKYNLNG